MSENFGLKIGLEGEREFKKSLAEINNSFKVLGSEMKLVDSQFDKNDKSAEALTARNQVLNKEIEQQKQKIETLRTALQNAAESFGENDRRTQSWQIQLNNAQAALGAAAAAVGTACVAAGKKLWDMANDVCSAGDQIDKTSQKIGISAESYQKWGYVFERCGADVNNLQTGMKKLSAVGLSIEELNGKSQDEQLSMVITALQGMEAGAERTAAANDLLGKSAVDMAAVLNTSAEETERLKQEAEDYGMVMSNEAVAASAAFEDSLTRLSHTAGGLKNRMVGELLPGITQITDGLADLLAGNEQAADELKNGVTSVIGTIRTLIPQFAELITSMAGAVLESAPGIIKALADGLLSAIPLIIEAGIKLLVALVQNLPTIITTIVAAIPQIISSVIDAVIGAIPQLVAAGVQLFIALIENLPTIIVEIVKAIPQIITGIVDAFGSYFGKMSEVGGNLLKGLWQGISDAGAWLWNQISGFFGGIVDGIKDFFGIHSPSKLFANLGGFMAEGLGEGFGNEMKDVSKSMQNAIPSDFDLDMNGTVSGFNGVQAQAFDITIPLSIDGVPLTKVISRIQWNQNKVTVRNAGAV